MVELAPVSASRSVPFMADPVDSDSPDRESAARGRFKIFSSVFSVCSSNRRAEMMIRTKS